MKHPSLVILQDYFEGELSNSKERLLQLHLEQCDRCSMVLSEMAKVDILFSKKEKIVVSQELKEKVFSDVFALLDKKIENKETKLNKKEERIAKVKTLSTELKGLLDFGIRELSNPLVQAASLVLILGLVTEIARTQTETKQINIIDNHVNVVYSELQGDQNEMD